MTQEIKPCPNPECKKGNSVKILSCDEGYFANCNCGLSGPIGNTPFAARQLYNALPRQEEWLPIETAPKDGTPVQACSKGPWPDWYSPGVHPTTVRWRTFHPNSPGKKTWRDQSGKPVAVTHYTPLPNPPEVTT